MEIAMANNIPKRKRYKKQVRLIQAKKWVVDNSSEKNLIKRYAKWFGVSRLCAAQELIFLGVNFEIDIINFERQLEIDKGIKRKKEKENRLEKDLSKSNFEFYIDEEDDEWV
jgi:hypothetical protein